MTKKILPQNSNTINDLTALQAVQTCKRNLQFDMDKNCVALYFAGVLWPEPGQRNEIFYALIAELARIGLEKDVTTLKILNYFHRMPAEFVIGGENGFFTEPEILAIINSVYRQEKPHVYGCINGFWDHACYAKEYCQFNLKFEGYKKINRSKVYYDFVSNWMSILNGNDFKLYLAFDLIEKTRGYSPGSVIFASQREMEKYSGVCLRRVKDSLVSLQSKGLIEYQVEDVFKRGIATEVKRILPIPRT